MFNYIVRSQRIFIVSVMIMSTSSSMKGGLFAGEPLHKLVGGSEINHTPMQHVIRRNQMASERRLQMQLNSSYLNNPRRNMAMGSIITAGAVIIRYIHKFKGR